ncbi:hypothetical protein WN944_000800 [Citrus x changshan-huyou]|uniref:Uncharacterized protein n=1 Tax=Citrus x changshan-huyou TaxID=2935761 RepID=A0AAP0MFA9_9ROSI
MSSTPGTRLLAFRAMRPPLCVDPTDLFVGEDIFDYPIAVSTSLHSYLATTIYLGETFCSYISINNSSTLEVRDVVLRAEIQTDRQRILLSLKVRIISFLEACFENHTKSNLYMDQVEFEPAQNWSATMLKADGPHSDYNAQSRETSLLPVLIRSGGGIHNYLYQLKMLSHGSSSPVKVRESNALGKLQITWRANLGESGRLLTQQILGTLKLKLTDQTNKEQGPFEIWLSQNDSDEEKAVIINGLRVMVTQFEGYPRSLEVHGKS